MPADAVRVTARNWMDSEGRLFQRFSFQYQSMAFWPSVSTFMRTAASDLPGSALSREDTFRCIRPDVSFDIRDNAENCISINTVNL